MLKYLEPLDWLPTAEDLPDSDDKPVDSELQRRIPNLLQLILERLFQTQENWFFGINMGIYYNPNEPVLVPDGFLSLGVPKLKNGTLRPSYVLWEEQGVIPQLVLEVVSKKYRGEYSTKKDLYQNLGVLYYVIYNPQRRRKNTLEVYRLTNGQYIPVIGNPVWMPELGLGLGKANLCYYGRDREWLFWYDAEGNRHLTEEELAQQADRDRAELDAERLRSQKLADKLRELGINPDDL